ncbi:MAG: PorP/SprF family type IX secretion system membrane protein [Saprospiraceae bacterium]|nr:PorP/SprF family type IX secretion system membrane protein [Candidatus Vicinibacter affinis]
MKTINSIIIFVALVTLGQSIKAQDYAVALKTPAVYNHYTLNPFLINPAHTGFEQINRIVFNFRNHWAGFEGSPKGLTLGINGSPAANMGLGGVIYSENFGVANRFTGQVNYAYNFRANETTKMSLGLSGSYIQYSLDNEAITDGLHQASDGIINAAVNGENFFGADLGFWADFSDKFKIGITLPQLVLSRLDNKKSDEDKPFNFVGFLGVKWNVPSYRMSIEPSVCVRKISDVPFGTDLNVVANMLDDRLFAGFTYSFGPSDSRVSFLGGVRVEQFRFYYSYDQSYQTFQNFNNGSHELTLSFDLGKGKQPNKQKMNGESDNIGEMKN